MASKASIFAVVLVALASGCSSAQSDYDDAYADDTASEELTSIDPSEVKAGETYSEYDQRRDSYGGERGTYGELGCTVDCSGHEAGAEWAERQGISNPDDCGGKSWSFEEGCRQYAESQSSLHSDSGASYDSENGGLDGFEGY